MPNPRRKISIGQSSTPEYTTKHTRGFMSLKHKYRVTKQSMTSNTVMCFPTDW